MRTSTRKKLLNLSIACLVIIGGACSREEVLGPQVDPLVGIWSGKYESGLVGESSPGSLHLIVRSGGEVAGNAIYTYEIDQDYVTERLTMVMNLSAEDSLSGTATWLIWVAGGGIAYTHGTVGGRLYADTLTGEGVVEVLFGGQDLTIPWAVQKVR